MGIAGRQGGDGLLVFLSNLVVVVVVGWGVGKGALIKTNIPSGTHFHAG